MLFITEPKTTEFIDYARDTYQKEFVLIRAFSYTDYTDGEAPWQIRWCPAVELEDSETGIRFNVYASSVFGWQFRDNYSTEVLLYCIKEQGIPFDDESKYPPCLRLENSRVDAIRLQQMTIRYNEIYSVDSSKSYHTHEDFSVPGSLFVFQILGGYVSDCWLNQSSPFCFDTPIEKYELFLGEVVGR